MNDLPKRKSGRLKDYDYSRNGAYFITICVQDRLNILSRIEGDEISGPDLQLSQFGQIVEKWMKYIPVKYPCVVVDKYVVMPNHIHIILIIDNDIEDVSSGTGNPSPTVGQIIGWFKYAVTKQINQMQNQAGERLFQRSYYDHIIRNESGYQEIWQYIDGNPAKWKQDRFYVADLPVLLESERTPQCVGDGFPVP